MKTTFSRQFAMIAALLLLCLLITGVSFRFLMLGTIESQNQQTMIRDAEAVAELAEAYDSVGDLQNNFDFHISLSLFTKVGDAEALLCDTDGVIRICSCEKFSCDHIGQTVDPVLLAEIQKDGSWYEETTLSGIYDESRYLAGQTLLASDGEQIGYVLVSAPMAQTKNFMLRSSTLFFYVAIAVLIVSMLAASFLSRMQVRPLGQMADAARRFGRGELGVRVEESPKNTSEINDLARAFNTMVDSLESSERRRQEFVANVSHELKTPMTTIGGYIDGMLDGTIPPEKQQHYMQIVSGEVRRLSRLVRNMLDISRLQAMGVEESRMTRFDLGELMSDVIITFEQKINGKGLNVDVELPDRPVWVKAERDGITQVVYNLLDNAIKFCPQGGKLGLFLALEGGKAKVTVQNSGPTIDPNELPLLFDRFHKADKSRSADREGWGLGLYIAKTIVGAYGGDIWATSENGITNFIFTLPTVR
mgnify:FL=1